MEELKVTPEELKMIIENGKVIGKGFFSTVFTYKDKLIKLDKCLYDRINSNDKSNSRWAVENVYKFDNNDFNDRSQLEYLASKQKDIKLTKFPTGIVTLKDVSDRIMGISPGIIIPYHKNHKNLEKLSKKDYKTVLIILKKLLLAVKELADNKISQEDLARVENKHTYNVLYKDDTPQIIDVSGEFIMADDMFRDAEEMYRGLGFIVMDFMNEDNNKLINSDVEIRTYDEAKELINDYEKRVK